MKSMELHRATGTSEKTWLLLPRGTDSVCSLDLLRMHVLGGGKDLSIAVSKCVEW